MKRIYSIILLSTGFSSFSFAQSDLEKVLGNPVAPDQKVSATFKAIKLINGHSNETIFKHELNFSVDHRFGDIAGKNGGIKNFFGLDQSTDIRIGFDYGLSDKLSVGIARAKGATAATQLYEGNLKYRLMEQTINDRVPVAITLFGSATASAVKASDDLTSATAYKSFQDRLTYVVQGIIARKFNSNFSFAITPTYIHRNFTAFNDQNDLFALGIGGRIKFSKRMAFVADYFLPFRNADKKKYLEQINDQKFYNPLGIGLEIETGGHVFHLNFTNATAIQESQFITDTHSSWLKNQYRWGFSIARRFSMVKKEKAKN
ncbi:DUF5777 family beta-barrel protein [Pedobacter punctiformis]|uniref:DUF5777 family beta-barrel protein n=1 Tax=Pedobacter punctiformis TaxID=3004097 RepID=A0ABT4LBZ2_9SPHI|nr:DUF5777 family beta-barrel protein [Pedobacter sp. HCMS5-2]MCZ4245443.1 DUF5777 family beta-barrel protein [Pedobacter sp. HCMS5-2]